uniref:Odorant receptor n=1 Tax=Anopheles coluzzii TaxID=1518534 RepID=A0A8W7Q1Q7_ANOCL
MVKFFRCCKARVSPELLSKKNEKPEAFLPSLRMILFIFRMFYAWPDEQSLAPNALWWYRAKGVLFRAFFIYLSAAAQLAYNFTVTSREELFAGMFVLLTQLVLILKMEFFYKNVSKIQQLIRRLNGKRYQQSGNAEEDMPLVSARKKSTIFWTLYFMFSVGLATEWLVISLSLTTLIVPVWPVVDHTTPYWVYLMVILHQFLREVLDLFSGPLLAQLYCSVFILCITEFRLLTDVNTMADTVQAVIYLLCLVIQVAQYCYFGNEINYMILKTSYSYLAVLRSMTD